MPSLNDMTQLLSGHKLEGKVVDNETNAHANLELSPGDA